MMAGIPMNTKRLLLTALTLMLLALAGSVTHSAFTSAMPEESGPAVVAPKNQASNNICDPVITGNQPGLGGTTHEMAYDGDLGTFFRSSFNVSKRCFRRMANVPNLFS